MICQGVFSIVVFTGSMIRGPRRTLLFALQIKTELKTADTTSYNERSFQMTPQSRGFDG
jgi:hypothetical protein